MIIHSSISSQFARERQREMRARADRQRTGRQLHVLARAARRERGTERRPLRSLRTALRLRMQADA